MVTTIIKLKKVKGFFKFRVVSIFVVSVVIKGPFTLDDNDVFFLSSSENSYIGDNATSHP